MRQAKDTIGAQNVQVSGHSGRMTGNINDLGRTVLAQRLEKRGPASFARGIEQNGGGLRRKAREQARKEVFRCPGHKLAICEPSGGGILPRGLHRKAIQFHANERFDPSS
jgi:hypothetical protein